MKGQGSREVRRGEKGGETESERSRRQRRGGERVGDMSRGEEVRRKRSK